MRQHHVTSMIRKADDSHDLCTDLLSLNGHATDNLFRSAGPDVDALPFLQFLYFFVLASYKAPFLLHYSHFWLDRKMPRPVMGTTKYKRKVSSKRTRTSTSSSSDSNLTPTPSSQPGTKSKRDASPKTFKSRSIKKRAAFTNEETSSCSSASKDEGSVLTPPPPNKKRASLAAPGRFSKTLEKLGGLTEEDIAVLVHGLRRSARGRKGGWEAEEEDEGSEDEKVGDDGEVVQVEEEDEEDIRELKERA